MREILWEIVIRLVTCTVGAIGFSILFYIAPKKIPLAVLGAALTIGIYLLLSTLMFVDGNEFLPNFAAAFAGAVYCEVIARVTKTPVPVYLTPALITLAPGRLLYYTMSHLVSSAYQEAWMYALLTLQASLGIAGGIIGASVVGILLRLVAQRTAAQKHKLKPKSKS